MTNAGTKYSGSDTLIPTHSKSEELFSCPNRYPAITVTQEQISTGPNRIGIESKGSCFGVLATRAPALFDIDQSGNFSEY